MDASHSAPAEVAALLAAHPAAEACIDADAGYCWVFHRAKLTLWRFLDGACRICNAACLIDQARTRCERLETQVVTRVHTQVLKPKCTPASSRTPLPGVTWWQLSPMTRQVCWRRPEPLLWYRCHTCTLSNQIKPDLLLCHLLSTTQ